MPAAATHDHCFLWRVYMRACSLPLVFKTATFNQVINFASHAKVFDAPPIPRAFPAEPKKARESERAATQMGIYGWRFIFYDGMDSTVVVIRLCAHTCKRDIFSLSAPFLVTCFAFYIRLAYTCGWTCACNAMGGGVRQSHYRATGQKTLA